MGPAPDGRKLIAESFKDVPEETRLIVRDNAQKLYRL